MKIHGYDGQSSANLSTAEPEMAVEQIRAAPPTQLIQTIITGLLEAETNTVRSTLEWWDTTLQDHKRGEETWQHDNQHHNDLAATLKSMLAAELTQTTTIPLPTTANWQDATKNDHDTAIICEVISTTNTAKATLPRANISQRTHRQPTRSRRWHCVPTRSKPEKINTTSAHKSCTTQPATSHLCSSPHFPHGRSHRVC